MIKKSFLIATLVASVAMPVLAQITIQPQMPVVDQREVRQEQRIQSGINSGQLNPKEVQKLEEGQQHIQNLENTAKADGAVTRAERRRLRHAQDHQSANIRRARHDSHLSVDQRQENQQKRITEGVKSGDLTSKEVHRLELGQQRVNAMENSAKADGVVSRRESRRLQFAQDHQSATIYRARHNAKHAQ